MHIEFVGFGQFCLIFFCHFEQLILGTGTEIEGFWLNNIYGVCPIKNSPNFEKKYRKSIFTKKKLESCL